MVFYEAITADHDIFVEAQRKFKRLKTASKWAMVQPIR